ncbi:MAG: hypothetical protein R3D01_13320 [Hyphomicrobiales bacterium]
MSVSGFQVSPPSVVRQIPPLGADENGIATEFRIEQDRLNRARDGSESAAVGVAASHRIERSVARCRAERDEVLIDLRLGDRGRRQGRSANEAAQQPNGQHAEHPYAPDPERKIISQGGFGWNDLLEEDDRFSVQVCLPGHEGRLLQEGAQRCCERTL